MERNIALMGREDVGYLKDHCPDTGTWRCGDMDHLSNGARARDKKWAYGTLGTLLGYWLNG